MSVDSAGSTVVAPQTASRYRRLLVLNVVACAARRGCGHSGQCVAHHVRGWCRPDGRKRGRAGNGGSRPRQVRARRRVAAAARPARLAVNAVVGLVLGGALFAVKYLVH